MDLKRNRKNRKNATTRIREATKKQHLLAIAAKPLLERTLEEQALWEADVEWRDHKNQLQKARVAAHHFKAETILAKSDRNRTPAEQVWLESYETKRERKREGDRLRRARLKELRVVGTTRSPGVSARGPLPLHYQTAAAAAAAAPMDRSKTDS